MSKFRRKAETLEEIVERLATEDAPTWAIEGLLPARGLAVLYGEPGAQKSFTIVDLAVRTATGVPWGGLMLRSGVVVIVAAEDPDGIAERLAACASALGQASEAVPIVVIPDPPPLQVGEFAQYVANQARKFGRHPVSLLIVDNLSAAFDGRNQEDSGAMGGALSSIVEAARILECAALIVHHPPRSNHDAPAGGAPIERAPDLILHQVLDHRSGQIRITAKKVRAGASGGQILMRAKSHRLEIGDRGRVIETLVLDDHRYLAPTQANATDARDSARRREAVMEEVAEAPEGLSTLAVHVRLIGRGFGEDKRTIQRELRHLADAGELTVIGRGRSTRYAVPVHRQSSGQSRHSPPLGAGEKCRD